MEIGNRNIYIYKSDPQNQELIELTGADHHIVLFFENPSLRRTLRLNLALCTMMR